MKSSSPPNPVQYRGWNQIYATFRLKCSLWKAVSLAQSLVIYLDEAIWLIESQFPVTTLLPKTEMTAVDTERSYGAKIEERIWTKYATIFELYKPHYRPLLVLQKIRVCPNLFSNWLQFSKGELAACRALSESTYCHSGCSESATSFAFWDRLHLAPEPHSHWWDWRLERH